jgi:hypothetical protein
MTEGSVSVGLVSEAELQLLGEGLNRAFPVDPTSRFGGLLQQIDEADRQIMAGLGENDNAQQSVQTTPPAS